MASKRYSTINNSLSLGFMMIIFAGACFGSSGIFAKTAMSCGLSPLSVASYRFVIASFVLLPIILILGPRHLMVKKVDALMLGFHGVVGVSVGIFLYFYTIRSISASLAVLLLYLHPVFTLIGAKLILHESITLQKVLAAAIVLIGCLLAIRGFEVEGSSLSYLDLILGIGAGLSYSFYTLFGKILLENRNIGAKTVTVYSILYAAVSLTAIQGLLVGFQPIDDRIAWLSLIGLALVPTLLAFGLYSFGLKRVEAGKAGIIGTVEVVSALILAFLFLGERLDLIQWIGASMVLFGVSIIQILR